MADVTDAELTKWFEEQYLQDNSPLKAEYDAIAEDEKQRFRDRAIENEKNRRNSEAQNQDKSDNQYETETITSETEKAGYTSDEWEQLFTGDNTRFLKEKDFLRGVDIVTLDEMGKLPSNFSSLSNDEKADTIERLKAELTPEERQTFNENETEARKHILEVYPPKRLVETDKWLEEAQNNTEDEALKKRIGTSRKALMETMESKISGYANDEIVVDQSNIADVYDGAKLMFDYVEKNSEKDNVKEDITKSREKLEEQINIYDENNGFTNLSESDSAEIYQAYQRASKSSEKTQNPPEEYANLWNNIELSDETQREEVVALFNEAAMKQAVRNVAIKNKDAKGEELDEALKEELQAVYTEQLGALIIANETQKNASNPKYTPDMAKADMEKAVADIQSGKKYKLDNKSLVGNFANYTNANMGYLNRLGTKIGKKSPVLGSMYDSVKKFDDTCIKRFNPLYGQIRSFGNAIAGNMGRQALNQAVRYGSQLIPGGNFVYGSYVAGQAAWRLGTKYKREKEEAKKNGKKFSGWGFLRDHLGEIGSSALLSVGAFIPGGNQALALGASALAIGTNAFKTFKRSREKGEGFWKSLGKSVTSVGTSAGAAVASSLLLGKAIDISGVDDFAAEYFSKTVPTGEFDPNNPHYNQEPVTDQAKIDELKGLNNQELAEKGYTFEHTTKDAEGAFLISEGKDGFTTHDYSQEELKFAEMRNDGVRYSEYLDKQWVHEDYQDPNSTNPLDHNEIAHDNAIKSLDKLAESHTEMNTYQNGEMSSNSEMLLYKLYQANVLAPNADAMSDSGIPIGQMLGATDANGNLVTYQDVFQKVLHGQELNETDYNVIRNVEDNVGGQLTFDENGNRILNDMGKIKDFDALGQGGNPDSYNAQADKGYDVNTVEGQDDSYGRFIETQYNPLEDNIWGMIYDNQEKGAQKELRERIGANGKKKEEVEETIKQLRKKIKDKDDENIPPIIVNEDENSSTSKPEKVDENIPHTEDHKYGYGKLLADEYKIIYGVDPQVVNRGTEEKPDRAYQSWIAYNNRVDEERRATGRDIEMYDFLEERREKLDRMILGGYDPERKKEVSGLADTHTTVVGIARDNANVGAQEIIMDHGDVKTPATAVLSKVDYEKHRDNPAMSAVIADGRQAFMQSNLTADNMQNRVTLTHFMHYLGEHLSKSSFAKGTKDISKNPHLDLGSGQHLVVDTNAFYFPTEDEPNILKGKTYEEKCEIVSKKPAKDERADNPWWIAAADVRSEMRKIYNRNHRPIRNSRNNSCDR